MTMREYFSISTYQLAMLKVNNLTTRFCDSQDDNTLYLHLADAIVTLE